MKVFWALIINNLRMSVLHKPVSFIIITILPIIVLVASSAFITYSATYINVGIADEDNSHISKIVSGILEGVDGIKIYKLDGKEDIEKKFKDNTINVAVEMSKGFDEGIVNGRIQGINIYANEGSNDYMLISSLLKNHMLNFRNLGRITGGDSEKLYKAVDDYMKSSEVVSREPLNDLYADYNNSTLFIGFLIMLIFFKSASVANTVNIDRDNNIYSRIFVSGTRTWQYYGANIVCNMLVVVFQLFVSILAMEYLADTSIGIGPATLLLILTVISGVAVSFGTLVVALTNNADSASMTSNLVNLVFVLLGGSFIEAEYFPPVINAISYVSPVRWAISCVKSLQEGASVADIYARIAVMVGMAAVFLFIALRVTAKKDKQFAAI